MWRVELSILLGLVTPSLLAQEMVQELCPGFVLVTEEDLNLTDSEVRLICGDPQVPGWKRIPDNQAIFSLRNFLQDRGFYFPEVLEQGTLTRVRVGSPTVVTGIVLENAPPEVEDWNRRQYHGERLTPALLKTLEQHLIHRLGVEGYACPELETTANAATGIITFNIKAGAPQPLIAVDAEEVPDLLPGILRRYDAFVLNKRFNADSLPLTAQRTVSDGVVRNTYFNTRCTPKGVVAEQKVLAGPPREVTLGFGFNTDRGLSARATWKHSRLGMTASQLFTSLTLSYRGQEFNTEEGRLDGAWYIMDYPTRFHLRPQFTIRHQSDNRFRVLSGYLALAPATTWDTQNAGGFVSLGPSINAEHTLRGPGPKESYFLSLAGDFRLTSHDFEFQRTTPQSGYEWTVGSSFSRSGLFAPFTSSVVRSRFTYLRDLPRDARKKVILGFRTGLEFTLIPSSDGGLGALPARLRNFLGGSTNLRGFGFQELPGPSGALSGFFTSFEVRTLGILPWQLQPFVFIDFGTVSPEPLHLGGPWFTSPGFGLRWQSPIGVFRASLAHGFRLPTTPPGDPHSHLQFHITYGEEF